MLYTPAGEESGVESPNTSLQTQKDTRLDVLKTKIKEANSKIQEQLRSAEIDCKGATGDGQENLFMRNQMYLKEITELKSEVTDLKNRLFF